MSRASSLLTSFLIPVFTSALLLALPGVAKAGTVIIPGNEEVSLAIDAAAGSLVQLPGAVKTITPSKSFQITDVAPSMDPATGVKMDVRMFVVKPVAGAGTKSDRVTFVLGDGRAVRVRLTAAPEAEKHYDLMFPGETKKARNPRFLGAEVALMRSMIRDEAGTFARQETDEAVALVGLGDFKARLVRIFASQGLAGYAFELRNTASEKKPVPLASLSLGSPNRAVLLHAGKDELEPCGFTGSPSCVTRLLVVARGEVSEVRTLGVLPGGHAPFMFEENADSGGRP